MSLPPPPQRRRRSPPALVDDALGEIFLRIPPDDPKSLVRAAAVCTSWRGIISDAAFDRCYKEFHGAPPVLGFLHNREHYAIRRSYEMAFVSGLPYEVEVKVWTSIFVSTASFCPPARRKRRHWHVLDSRHGLVLFYTPKTRHDFLVCDLVTCKRWWINASPKCKDIMSADLDDHDEDENRTWNAMMFCAKEGCGHLDCHGLPFQVVFVGSYDKEGIILASVYSSETGEWSGTDSIAQPETIDKRGHSALVGNNVYFPCEERNRIVNYDMAEQELSVIDAPSQYQSDIVLMGAEDGMLLFTTVQNSKLCLLSMEAGPNRAEGWARSRVIELKPLLPLRALREDISVVGFAEGVGVIFLRTVAGLFKIELTAGRSKKVHEGTSFDKVMPYTRFYTGERGAAPSEKLHAHLFGATTV